jgi:uncharacterized short protein YbdD (DUF466 family)
MMEKLPDYGVIAADRAGMSPFRLKVRQIGETIRSAYHQVFGIPDYKAYLAHRRCHHPGEPCLSPREFAAWWFERKYSRKGARCC